MKKRAAILAAALTLATISGASAADRRPIVAGSASHFCDACHLIVVPTWRHAGFGHPPGR